MAGSSIRADGRRIHLSRPDKILFPDPGLSKRDLARYYCRIAPFALPHCRGRPLTMERYPDGIDSEGFFQRHIPGHFPDWIARVRLDSERGTVTQPVADNAATLVYLADQGCITPHLALAPAGAPDRPDRMIFDLDPSDDDFTKVQEVAQALRAELDARGLASFVQSTGSRGLHVLVPLDGAIGFDPVRAYARDLAGRIAGRAPALATVAQRKDARGTRVLIDYLRNAYAQSAVAPYAVRARPGAPVATPLRWNEALAHDMRPDRYRVANIFRRLGQIDDPWAGISEAAAPASRVMCRS